MRIQLPTLGFGGAPLGNMFKAVPDDQAQATLEAAWQAGIRYYDTSPHYGAGRSETRFGEFLADKPRDDLSLIHISEPTRQAESRMPSSA